MCYLDTCRYVLSDPSEERAHGLVLNLVGQLARHLLKNMLRDGEHAAEPGGGGGQHAVAVSSAALVRAMIAFRGVAVFSFARNDLVRPASLTLANNKHVQSESIGRLVPPMSQKSAH